MTPNALLRHAWMDLLSAADFLLAWLLSGWLSPDTRMSLLYWPVVFECLLVLALGFATFGDGIRSAVGRNLWFAFVAALYLAIAWALGRRTHFDWLWLSALRLLYARCIPPAGLPWFGTGHRDWLFRSYLAVAAMMWRRPWGSI